MNLNTYQDQRIIMTLDAGGTNFVFSAMQGNEEIVEPVHKAATPEDLQKILDMVSAGFEEIRRKLPSSPSAISFAFPGPANYPKGIIGDLPNFKTFSGGVPLGPMLEDQFKIPVFINNDGNLFAYGEALAGFLPVINKRLKETGSLKQYDSLIGFTLGTGFGAGIVIENKMLVGNSSCGAEIHNTLNAWNSSWNAEESVSTRAIRRVYAENAGIDIEPRLMPRDINAIANGRSKGNREAAEAAFKEFGESLGNSIANAMSLLDAIVVLGGGITAAWDIFAPYMFREINRNYKDYLGNFSPRLSYKVYNLEDDSEFNEFATGRTSELTVPGSGRKITYDDLPRNGIGLSKLGASNAIAIGAYAFALQQLDN